MDDKRAYGWRGELVAWLIAEIDRLSRRAVTGAELRELQFKRSLVDACAGVGSTNSPARVLAGEIRTMLGDLFLEKPAGSGAGPLSRHCPGWIAPT